MDFPTRMKLLAENPCKEYNFLALLECFIPTDKCKSSRSEQVLQFLVRGIKAFIMEHFVLPHDCLRCVWKPERKDVTHLDLRVCVFVHHGNA